MKVTKKEANSASLLLKYSKDVRSKKLKTAAAVILGSLSKGKTSALKKISSKSNGKLGGRPRKA